MNGKCRESGIVYTVTSTKQSTNRPDKAQIETCIELTDTKLANHRQSFSNPKLTNSTELSKYIWTLKDNNSNYKLTWKIQK